MTDAWLDFLWSQFHEDTEVNKKKAEEIKEQANASFKNKDYQKAIQLYTTAIKLNPYVAAYFGNRSFTFLRVERFEEALFDAFMAVRLDESYTKAYYRSGCANMALGNFVKARNDFKTVMEQQPKSVEACTKLHECRVLLIRRKSRSPKSTGEKAKTDGAPKMTDLKPEGCIPQYEIIPEGGNPANSWTSCQDEHLHDDFITMHDLMTLERLPPAFRNQMTKDALQEYSDRTVRVQVKKYSPNRPRFFTGSDVPFPGHEYRGEEATLYGTGFVIPGKFHDNEGLKFN